LVATEKILFNARISVDYAKERRLPVIEPISERTPEIRSCAKGGFGKDGVKGLDERNDRTVNSPSQHTLPHAPFTARSIKGVLTKPTLSHMGHTVLIRHFSRMAVTMLAYLRIGQRCHNLAPDESPWVCWGGDVSSWNQVPGLKEIGAGKCGILLYRSILSIEETTGRYRIIAPPQISSKGI
jgi:hypothetical protein